MKKSLILLLFIILCQTLTMGQIDKDSLLNKLGQSSITNQDRYKIYNLLSRNVYIYSNPDSSLYFAKEHQRLAQKNNDFEQLRLSLDNIGVAYLMAADYDSAHVYYKELIKIIKEEGAEKYLCNTYSNAGACYYAQGNDPMALDFYLKALAEAEKFDQDKTVIYIMLGLIYRNQQKYDEARSYTTKSLELANKNNDKKSIAQASCNLGLIYDDEGNLDMAKQYYQECYDVAEEIGDELTMNNALENMAIILCQKEEYLLAEDILLKVLAWWEGYDDMGSVSNVLGNLGTIKLKLEEYDEAIQICKRAYELSREVNALSLIEPASMCLYEAYKHTGNTELALKYHEIWSATHDSLFNEENTEELTRLEMQFDFDKKELVTNQELKRQKFLRNGFLGGFLAIFAFSAVVFKQRNRIRKEKHRSDELLLNILPEEVAEELKSKGSAEAKLIDHVTVLFTDFKGFTQLSEQLSAQELVETINECFSAFDHIMEKYGIEKIKTIGDAYMAAGGLPTINDTHPEDVVRAALDIQAFIQQEKEKRIAEGKLFFEIRIGIHSGPVVAGIVGVKKFQYDIWGDTVNTASRMESSGEVGRVNISGDTYALVKDKFHCEHRGKIHAKGKGEIDMYFVEELAS